MEKRRKLILSTRVEKLAKQGRAQFLSNQIKFDYMKYSPHSLSFRNLI
jgi:hypothetical protein